MSDVNGTFAVTEGGDTAAFAGSVVPVVVTGTLAVTEGRDTALIRGRAPGPDRTPVVRSSSMLWSAQVAIVDAMDDLVDPRLSVEAQQERRQPVIYPFNRGGKRGFIAPLNPYE